MGVRGGGPFRIDMPRLSQYFTRAAMFNLLLGFTFGALMLSNKGIPIHPSLWRLLPAHIEILLLGWTLQLAFGVAFWIAPRFLERTQQVNRPPRGDETGAWIALVLLNAGVWLVALGAAMAAPPVIIFLGRAAELGAAISFGLHIWPRIVPKLY